MTGASKQVPPPPRAASHPTNLWCSAPPWPPVVLPPPTPQFHSNRNQKCLTTTEKAHQDLGTRRRVLPEPVARSGRALVANGVNVETCQCLRGVPCQCANATGHEQSQCNRHAIVFGGSRPKVSWHTLSIIRYRGGGFAPSQIRGGKFRCGKFRGAPRQSVSSPARVHRVYCWCTRNSQRTLNFAWGISRSI